jgi:Flp pilus assembly pilin Flp
MPREVFHVQASPGAVNTYWEGVAMTDLFRKLWITTSTRLQPQDGQAVTEYAIILALIVVGAVALLTTLGGTITSKLTTLNNTFK